MALDNNLLDIVKYIQDGKKDRIKMRSKKHTQSRSCTYTDCLKSVIRDLFHPRSKKALIRYKSLKLVDVKQLKLVNLPVVATFLRFAVSISVTVVIMLCLFATYWAYNAVQLSTYEISLSKKEDVSYVVKTRYSSSNASKGSSYVKDVDGTFKDAMVGGVSKTFAQDYPVRDKSVNEATDEAEEIFLSDETGLSVVSASPAVSQALAEPPRPAKSEKPAVLGASINPVCSFRINNSYYADGSRIALDRRSRPAYVCASLSKPSHLARWIQSSSKSQVDKGTGIEVNSRTRCISTETLSVGDALILSVETAEKAPASCSISFAESSENRL